MLEIGLLIVLISVFYICIQKTKEKEKEKNELMHLTTQALIKSNHSTHGYNENLLQPLTTLLKMYFVKEQLQLQHHLLLFIKKQRKKITVCNKQIYFNKKELSSNKNQNKKKPF